MSTTASTPGGRSTELSDAIASANDPSEITLGLPDHVIGDSSFTFMQAWPSVDDLQAWDVSFNWDGFSRRATWTLDISELEDQSPASSAPIHGWASWQTGDTLLVAFASPELEMEGWFRLPNASPLVRTNTGDEENEDDEGDVISRPSRWVALAKAINLGIIQLNQDDGSVEGGLLSP